MNLDLKNVLEKTFSPLGIVAWSGCCTLDCSGSYNEKVHKFGYREQGIVYFCLYLHGMNYKQYPQRIFVSYNNFEYLTNNWDFEKGLIYQWCNLLNRQPYEYSIIKPQTENECIIIHFERPLALDLNTFE